MNPVHVGVAKSIKNVAASKLIVVYPVQKVRIDHPIQSCCWMVSLLMR